MFIQKTWNMMHVELGLVASTEGKKLRKIVEYGIEALKSCMA